MTELEPYEAQSATIDLPSIEAAAQLTRSRSRSRVTSRPGKLPLPPGPESPAGSPSILTRLNSNDASQRAAALQALAQIGDDDAYVMITDGFDDQAPEVRNAAARALYNLHPDYMFSFSEAVRDASGERHRRIAGAVADSGLAREAIANLAQDDCDGAYRAFSLLWHMAVGGEVQCLIQSIEEDLPAVVRITIVELLALSGRSEAIPALRRLAVRRSLSSELRSALMQAIHQLQQNY